MNKELERLKNEHRKLEKLIYDFEKLSKDPYSHTSLLFKSELKRIKNLKWAEKSLRKKIKEKERGVLNDEPLVDAEKDNSSVTKLNNPIKTPAIIASVMLFIAILPLPYGYYQLLRLIVCGIGAYIAFQAYKMKKQPWAWTMGIIAFLFNPLIPIHLDKATWGFIDLVVAVIFLVSISKLKEERK